MNFAWQTIHYPDLAAYRAALLPFTKPTWINGITVHHTWKPTEADWRGAATMAGLARYYAGLGWPAGPHLFVAPDGIWAGTPLASPGVHAGACNKDHIGIEIVGDFDAAPWPAPLAERVYALVRLLCGWGRITPERVQGHRECLPNKSCPGRAIDMDVVRAELWRRMGGF